MGTTVASEALRVVGLGVAIPAAPGPALLGTTTDWSIVLAVSEADGTPLSGLTRSAFSVAALVSRRGGTSSVPLDAATIDEPMAGVYGLHFTPGTIGRLTMTHIPCVVDVRTEGARGEARGRTLVLLGA